MATGPTLVARGDATLGGVAARRGRRARRAARSRSIGRGQRRWRSRCGVERRLIKRIRAAAAGTDGGGRLRRSWAHWDHVPRRATAEIGRARDLDLWTALADIIACASRHTASFKKRSHAAELETRTDQRPRRGRRSRTALFAATSAHVQDARDRTPSRRRNTRGARVPSRGTARLQDPARAEIPDALVAITPRGHATPVMAATAATYERTASGWLDE